MRFAPSVLVAVALCACGRLGFALGATAADGGALDTGPLDAGAVETGTVTRSLRVGPVMQLTTTPQDSDEPDLVWANDRFAIVWHDQRHGGEEVYMAFLDPGTGARLGPEIRVSNNAGDSRDAAIAHDGTDFGVTWNDSATGSPEVHFARVSGAGALLGEVQLTDDPANTLSSDVVWTGSEYVALFDDDRDSMDRQLYAARLDAAGSILSPAMRVSLPMARGARHVAAVPGSSDIPLVWHDFRDGASEIFFGTLDATDTLVGEVRVTTSVVPSRFPDLIAAGPDLALAYEDDRSGRREIWLEGLSRAGTRTFGPLQISDHPDVAGNPRIAFGLGVYLVAWAQGPSTDVGDIVVALATETEVLQTRVLVDATLAKLPTVAFDGARFLVAWDDESDGDGDIHLAFVEVVEG